MNDLRTAAQQALECLRGVARGKYDGNAAGVCAALEAALAQQPEPVAKMTAGRAVYFMERFKREEKLLGPNEQAALDFVISMLERQPEPLVWEPVVRDLPALTQREYDALHADLRWNYKKIAPPQRPPLTDKDMLDIIDAAFEGGSLLDLARVIERKVRGEKE